MNRKRLEFNYQLRKETHEYKSKVRRFDVLLDDLNHLEQIAVTQNQQGGNKGKIELENKGKLVKQLTNVREQNTEKDKEKREGLYQEFSKGLDFIKDEKIVLSHEKEQKWYIRLLKLILNELINFRDRITPF